MVPLHGAPMSMGSLCLAPAQIMFRYGEKRKCQIPCKVWEKSHSPCFPALALNMSTHRGAIFPHLLVLSEQAQTHRHPHTMSATSKHSSYFLSHGCSPSNLLLDGLTHLHRPSGTVFPSQTQLAQEQVKLPESSPAPALKKMKKKSLMASAITRTHAFSCPAVPISQHLPFMPQ